VAQQAIATLPQQVPGRAVPAVRHWARHARSEVPRPRSVNQKLSCDNLRLTRSVADGAARSTALAGSARATIAGGPPDC
jgi:hypothetical protein